MRQDGDGGPTLRHFLSLEADVRPRVLVPLLLALAAALGLVVGAVLPSGSPPPTADGSSPSPSSSEPSSDEPTDDPNGEPSSSASVGDVTGEGGGVSAVNLPQPEWPVKKLAPGEKPPQFVTISFDGSCNNDIMRHYLDTADQAGAYFTFFVSGLCLLPAENRFVYETPGREAGSSAIGFADDAQEVVQRTANYTEAYRRGHEIGTHFLGHWCEPNDGAVNSWDSSEWQSEFSQDVGMMNNWAANSGVTDPVPMPFNHSVIKGARTPCLEGQRDVMYPVFVDNGFTYDSSNPGVLQWPIKNEYGLWDFPLQTMKVVGYDRSNLSMDYNFLCAQNDCQQQADQASCDRIEQSTYDSLMAVTDALYNGNRAPFFFGNHFNTWVCGAYQDAITRFVLDASAQYPDLQFVSNAQLVAWLDAQDPAVLKKLVAQGVQSY
jgi:hypothetical protein